MPLPGYGVAVGSLVSFTRDSQHDFGAWYHGHITLDVGGSHWESALDVDAPQEVGVAYRLVTDLERSDLGPAAALSPGWTPLASTPASGALDYVRARALRDGVVFHRLRTAFAPKAPAGWVPPPPEIGQPGGPRADRLGPPPFGPGRIDSVLEKFDHVVHRPSSRFMTKLPRRSFPWISSSGDNALDALRPYLTPTSRIYIYGQRYTDGGQGVHDVHCNQGDPAGSRWFDTDGIWQDGGVACEQSDGSVAIWQVRFNTQSLNTDDNGHPRP